MGEAPEADADLCQRRVTSLGLKIGRNSSREESLHSQSGDEAIVGLGPDWLYGNKGGGPLDGELRLKKAQRLFA